MIAGAPLAVSSQPATGQSFQCWLNAELSACGTGITFPFKLKYSIDPDDLPAVTYWCDVTDPEAGSRLKQSELLNWTKNLHALNVVAGIIIPGIRELTEPEQHNLRNIYRKLYRKA